MQWCGNLLPQSMLKSYPSLMLAACYIHSHSRWGPVSVLLQPTQVTWDNFIKITRKISLKPQPKGKAQLFNLQNSLWCWKKVFCLKQHALGRLRQTSALWLVWLHSRSANAEDFGKKMLAKKMILAKFLLDCNVALSGIFYLCCDGHVDYIFW